MKRGGELESRLLILVTLALVAFGLVEVYSATSAPATVGAVTPADGGNTTSGNREIKAGRGSSEEFACPGRTRHR